MTAHDVNGSRLGVPPIGPCCSLVPPIIPHSTVVANDQRIPLALYKVHEYWRRLSPIMPCPFDAKLGFSTRETRQEYLDLLLAAAKKDHHHTNGLSSPSEERIESLFADLDTTQPLYYWQLYSILGKDPIVEFITTFYSLIWADDETDEGAQFKAAFANVCDTMDFHIKAQSAYWIDSFGGGRVYWGGHSRLGFHHYSRHAEPVMNATGARRWMNHMRHAIASYDFVTKGYPDPRIVPCLVDFLHAKMRTYALDFEWDMDESDFDYERFRFPPTLDADQGDYKVSQTLLETRADDIENVKSYLNKFLNHSA